MSAASAHGATAELGAPGPLVLLLGAPGARADEVAHAVGELLGARVLDTDELVERSVGRSVGEVIVEDGEAAFRELERAAVLEALGASGVVVAVGSGAVDDDASRAALTDAARAGVPVVLLEVSLAEAVPRLGFNQPRPVALGNPRQRWNELLAERLPRYLAVATSRVSTDGRTVLEAAEAVVAALTGPAHPPTSPETEEDR